MDSSGRLASCSYTQMDLLWMVQSLVQNTFIPSSHAIKTNDSLKSCDILQSSVEMMKNADFWTAFI